MYSFDPNHVELVTSVKFNNYQYGLFEGLCSDKKVVIADALRQSGSSYFCNIMSAYIATHYYNCNILMVTPNVHMGSTNSVRTESVIQHISKKYPNRGSVLSRTRNGNIRLTNGSTINFRSINVINSVNVGNLSSSYDFVFFDEIKNDSSLVDIIFDAIKLQNNTKFVLFPFNISRNITEIMSSDDSDNNYLISKLLLGNMENNVKNEITKFYGCTLPKNVSKYKEVKDIYIVSSTKFMTHRMPIDPYQFDEYWL